MNISMAEALDGLRTIARKCWETSEEKGWHKEKTVFANLQGVLAVVSTLLSDRPDILALLTGAIEPALDTLGGPRTKGVPVMSKLMLIVTEVAEAAEIYRDAKNFPDLTKCYEHQPEGFVPYVPYTDVVRPEDGALAKPEGFPSELADCIIRLFDLAEDLGIDIADEIERKMRYNATRTHRHGGKIA